VGVNPGAILDWGHHVSRELAGLDTTTAALMSHKLVFLNPEPGLGQIKDLTTGHELGLSGKHKPTLTTMGRPVAMNHVGLLDHFQRVARMARLPTGLISGLFGQGWLDEGLLLIAIGSGRLMGVGRILG